MAQAGRILVSGSTAWYSTYPIKIQPQFSRLDLVCLAKQYATHR